MVIDIIAAFVMIAISVVVSTIAYLIMPKPKSPKPEAVRDLENPTAEAGRPKPVIFGTIIVKGLNVLGFWDKNSRTYKVKA